MMNFEVNYTGADRVQDLLKNLHESFNATDQAEILSKVGQIYLDETRKRFISQYDVDRKKWTPLSKTTIRRKGHSTIGYQTGKLYDSIKMQVFHSSVFIGTDVPYAPTFHYKIKKGQYTKGNSHFITPWGDIPARTFIGRNKRLDDSVIKMLKKHFKEKFGLDTSLL